MGRGRLAVLLLSAGLGAAPAACDDTSSSKPIVIGDEVMVDVDATTQTSQPSPICGGANEPFDTDGSYCSGDGGSYSAYGSEDGGYAPLAWCTQCGCPKDSYCFGGGTGYTTFSGVCNNAEAGPPHPFAIGCNPPPSGCDASDCVCLIQALSGQMPCIAECVGSKAPVSVYCPVP